MNMGAKWQLCFSIVHFSLIRAFAYEPVPRWGQATVLINNVLFVHGGKTDPYNSYGYTSAPNSNDALYLPLSSSFDSSSPPWQLVNASNPTSTPSPALSWHTLSALNTTHLLLFGGQPGPNSPVVLTGAADSAFLVDVSNPLHPVWVSEPATWADEPIRRIHHSAISSSPGDVYITGGEKADDSSISFAEHYVFNPTISSFTSLPSANSPPGITGHASVWLPDGRLLVFGGYSQSSGGLLPLSTIWIFDSSQTSPSWSTASVSGTSLPSPRRAFATTVISGGKILIHGGSDDALQINLADGWTLDPSQDPMIWSEIKSLSQLGARRDHFAASLGDQVIFCFGYGNDGPEPATLQIYNTERDAFETTLMPSSSPPAQSSSSPSQTSRPIASHSVSPSFSHGSGAYPTNTADPNSGDPDSGGSNDHSDQDSKHNTTAIAVGSALGLLGLIIIILTGTYLIRRRRQRIGVNHFRALDGGSADYGDGESEHLAGSIPAAGILQHGSTSSRSYNGWGFSVLDSLGLATALTLRTRNTRHIPERKDMLADEDTRDFTPWYEDNRRERMIDRAWSLKSIIPSLMRSREPSVTDSIGNSSWREKTDPFSDNAALIGEEGTGYMLSASRGRSQQSSTSYNDPFVDPIDEESHDDQSAEREQILNQPPYLHPIPQQLPTLKTILPMSQQGYPLTPLTEQTSRTSLTDGSISASSHATRYNNPFDTISSLTSHTSFDPPKSLLSSSSAVGSTTHMKRSDSWWSRFARTSFLDRRSSDASRKILDFRDPNPPPRLGAIEETSRTASLVDRQQSGSSEQGPGLARHASRLQGGHNKSQSSVRTADTEAIEKMARTMDVAHLMRSDSRRTTSTIATTLSLETHPSVWIDEDRGAGMNPEHTFASPVDMSDAEAFSHHGDTYQLPTSPSAMPAIYSSTSHSKHIPPPSSGAVAAKIQEFERRRSHDSDAFIHGQAKQISTRRANSQPVGYGLIPRANLFVANPDHRNISSDGTS